jgi:hypothetical protein
MGRNERKAQKVSFDPSTKCERAAPKLPYLAYRHELLRQLALYYWLWGYLYLRGWPSGPKYSLAQV